MKKDFYKKQNKIFFGRRFFASAFSTALYVMIPLFFLPGNAYADEPFSVTPIIIDKKALTRDILVATIHLENNTARKANLYAVVNNVNTSEGKQEFLDPSKADLSNSLANWILITRGVIPLMPGDIKDIDFRINVDRSAQPGMYHAIIAFADGTTRPDAEAALSSSPFVTINLEVLENIKERLQLTRFVPDRTFFGTFPASFTYDIENTGNRALQPTGDIRIYNRRGEEVGLVPLNSGGKEFGPNAKATLAGIWAGSGGFGRYKALIDLRYGADGGKAIQDAVFFWVLPWQKLLILFGIFALLVIMGTVILHKKYEGHVHRRALHIAARAGKAGDQRMREPQKNAGGGRIIDIRDRKRR